MKTTLGIVVAACALVMGCTESHAGGDSGDDFDAGRIMLFDSGMVMPGFDAGMVMPGFDAGMVNPGTDAGMVMPGTDAGMVMPGTDAGMSGGVDCGGMTCGASEICCVTLGGGSAMPTCTTEAACMGATVTCDGPEDCPGQACCVMRTGMSGSVECGPSDCMLRACRSVADCPMGSMCCPFMGTGICSSIGCFGGP
jgi:hypothetical protein